ncbi:MAG TPA: selenoprotein B, partial [Pyrinomonadaceae bacterium]|nr:selenoprotein B [Pyrinomonadaceae bacterium]
MSTLSRKCVPFTPFERALDKSIIALVTAGGVHHKEQEAFNISDELGDLTYRVIEPDAETSELMVTHHHYDHADADEDINVVFPLD